MDKNIQKIKPSGIFTNYIYKAIPLAFDESMSYYETLCGILSLLKTQEEVVNNNADLLAELETYVQNYFKNLDVQTEINNKLDQMAESGQLADIIAQYLQVSSILAYNSVEDMKNANNLVENSFVETYGFYNYGDGGSAKYKIRKITNVDVIDNIFLFSLTNYSDLVAELIKDTTIYLKKCGLSTNKSAEENTEILNKIITFCNENDKYKIVFDDNYTIKGFTLTNNNIDISGSSDKIEIITTDEIKINSNFNFIHDIKFMINTDIILLNVSGKYNNFDNLYLYGNNDNTGIGINVTNFCNEFTNCSIREFKKSCILSNNYIVFNNCYLINCDNSVDDSTNINITAGDNIIFNNCDIEKGFNILNITGGNITFDNCYIESATSRYHLLLTGGTVNITNCCLNSLRINKQENCNLTLSKNKINLINDDYLIHITTQNIGYLVIDNNIIMNNQGYVIRLVDSTPTTKIYVYIDNTWVTGTKNKYLYIMQDRCWCVESSNHILPISILNREYTKGGVTSNRPSENLYAGLTYGDRVYNKLCFYNAYLSKWVDALGNTPVEKRSAIPTSGNYVVGDIIFNSNPTNGGYIGWVCVSEGNPGTWYPFGKIGS